MENSKSNAITKALQILNCFKGENRPLSVQKLSGISGINRTTVHRIVQTLLAEGFLLRDPGTGKVSLGTQVMELGRAMIHSFQSRSLVELARPHMERLREKTGYAVTLELFTGNQSILVSVLNGERVWRFAGIVGDVMPWHAAAGAKATLAYVSESELAPILRQEMVAYTEETITDVDTYVAELQKVRRLGYATDIGETQPGINAVAAPLFDYRGEPVGSVIAVDVGLDVGQDVGQKPGQKEARAVRLIRETAAAISKENFSPQT